MFSSLTREQKQRREALREAKALLGQLKGEEPDAAKLNELATFILGQEGKEEGNGW